MNPSSLQVRVVRHFDASPERVFDAWLDPAVAARWLFATATGRMVRAEIDPRVGGRFTFTDRRDSRDFEHVGTYVEIDRPRRLIFDFGLPAFSEKVDRVTIEIEPQGEGCELTLTQTMHEEFAEYADRSERGWRTVLEGLAKTLA
ncbi:MAG: SRPBCC family protein [Fimbriimonas sp.]